MAAPFKVEFLPEIDLATFSTYGDKILIKPADLTTLKTAKGIHLGDKSVDEIVSTVITAGEVILVGPDVKNKSIVPGITVYFYRQNSEGAFRSGSDALFVFNEYHLFGGHPTVPVTVTATGEITNL